MLLRCVTAAALASVLVMVSAGNASTAFTSANVANLEIQVSTVVAEEVWAPLIQGEAPTFPSLACLSTDIPELPEGNQIQAILASGKGINDLGDYDLCNHANGTQFCIASFGFNNVSVTGLKLGLCAASTCNSTDLETLINTLVVDSHKLFGNSLYLNNATVHCAEPPPETDGLFWGIMTWYFVLIVLCGLGTWLKWEPAKKPEPRSTSPSENGLAEPLMDVAKDAAVQDPEKREPGCCAKIVMTWDMKTNFKKLMLPSVDPRLECLNGVRALSMFWIIYGHTFFNALIVGFKNVLYMVPNSDPDGEPGYSQTYQFLMVPGGYFAVDAFFWLGGFLVVFHLLNEIKKKGKGPPIYILYIFRIIRIVPTYTFFLLFFMGVLKYIGNGPQWYQVAEHTKPCFDYWWANLLFVNNLIPDEHMCMDWSWYLSDDMQFFLITPYLIWVYHKSRAAGIALCVFLLAVSTGITIWLIIGGTKMPDGYVLPTDLSSDSLAPDNKYFVSEVYLKPYTRIQSYLVGILTGYINDIYSIRASPPRKINWWLDFILTAVCSTICWVCVFGEKGQYEATPSPWGVTQDVMYNGFTKIAFTAALGVICMLCVSGNARFINWFLTWWAWNPMARLTFGAYLVHPILMDLFYYTQRQDFYWDDYFMILHYVFFLVMAYLCATAQFLMLERPIMSLTGLLKGALGGGKKKRKNRDGE